MTKLAPELAGRADLPDPQPAPATIWRNRLLAVLAAGFLAYHLYTAMFGAPEAMIFRGTHLLFALLLSFVAFPIRSLGPVVAALLDVVLIAASFGTLFYLWLHYDEIIVRIIYVHRPSEFEIVLGIVLVAVILEATRRVIGVVLPIIGFLFLAYAYFWADISLPRLVEINYLTTEGIFGVALGVAATYVVLFVFFGSLFERSGAGRLFSDLAMALAGRASGGPAKVACMTSALFGSISGSSVANVATSGAFTIPLMKRLGYRSNFAGAVEAVASTGGQLLPPIMGAAAFLMAEFLGTSYLNVAAMALAPALIFYFSLFMALHFHAKRQGLHGLSSDMLPALLPVLRSSGHLMIPIIALVATLVMGYSAPYAALIGIATIIPVVLLRRSSREQLSLAGIVEAISFGAKNTLVVSNACAIAGIIMGSIFITGLGVDFTQMIVRLAGEQMFFALVLTMCAALILGMGLPTAPAYIVQVALLIPALINLGVVREAAHFFALYFSALSAITPPVAIAVFAASAISGGNVWTSARDAALLALPAYLIPYFIVYSPALIMQGETIDIVIAVATALVGVTGLAGATMGYVLARLGGPERIIVGVAATALIAPGTWTDTAGITVLVLWLGYHLLTLRRTAAVRG